MKFEYSQFVQNRRVILMSMREEYFRDIVTGKKHFEYRKKYCEEESTAYIYISKTKKAIIGKIWFGKPIMGNAEKIATIAEKDQKGNYNNILEYISDEIGYAIPIKKVELVNPIRLNEIKAAFADFYPPQSYYYLEKKKELLDFVKKNEKI